MARIRKRRERRATLIHLVAAAAATMPIAPVAQASQSLFRDITSYRWSSASPRTYDPDSPGETCYSVLHSSDADGNGIVTNDEYTSFVYQLSEGHFDVPNYAQLPFVIKVNFVYLSCLCRFMDPDQGGGSSCCEGPDGGIRTDGAGPGEVPTTAEETYLRTVCSETQGAIDYARGEEGTEDPTSAPTREPTAQPSSEPTKEVSSFA